MLSFNFNSLFGTRATPESGGAVKVDSVAAFGNAVRAHTGVDEVLSKDPEQPSKAPLFDTIGTYFLPAEEQLKAVLLDYFNFQGTNGATYPRLAELEAKCVEPDMRSVFELVTLFKRAARLGDGKKTTFLNAMEYYLRHNPERTAQFLVLIGLLGSCKDYRTFANSAEKNLTEATARFYLAFMTESFGTDFDGIRDSKAFNELRKLRGLFFKWMPINKGAKKTAFYAKMVNLFYEYKFGRKLARNQKSYNLACMHFRNFVVKNRNTPEQIMSKGLGKIDGTSAGINFLNTLPALTRSKHSGFTKKKVPRALDRHLTKSLEEWRRSLVRGDPKVKVNTAQGTVSALSVLDQYMDQYVSYLTGGGYGYAYGGYGYTRTNTTMPAMTPEQEIAFKAVVEKSQEVTGTMDMIPMVDLSGSMWSYKAINLALIMAMIFTMRPEGHPLDGIWIAFSTDAQIMNMGHCSTPTEWLARFAVQVKQTPCVIGYSTNYMKALNNLIAFAGKNSIPVPDILVVTDMRVDEWVRSGGMASRERVFTQKTLGDINRYNRRFGFDKIPNMFVANCSHQQGLVPMTHQFENGAYYSCGPKGTQVSVLKVLQAFCELKFDEVAQMTCTPTPWTTMLKTLHNFNEKLKKEYEIDMLGDIVLLGENWFT